MSKKTVADDLEEIEVVEDIENVPKSALEELSNNKGDDEVE